MKFGNLCLIHTLSENIYILELNTRISFINTLQKTTHEADILTWRTWSYISPLCNVSACASYFFFLCNKRSVEITRLLWSKRTDLLSLLCRRDLLLENINISCRLGEECCPSISGRNSRLLLISRVFFLTLALLHRDAINYRISFQSGLHISSNVSFISFPNLDFLSLPNLGLTIYHVRVSCRNCARFVFVCLFLFFKPAAKEESTCMHC